jgi:protein TonB
MPPRVVPSRAIYKPASKWGVVAAVIGAIALHALAVYIVALEPEKVPVEIEVPFEQIAEVTFETAAPEPVEPESVEEPVPVDAPPPPIDPPEFVEETVERTPDRPRSNRTIAPLARPRPAGVPGGTMSMSSARAVAISAPRPEYPYEARRSRITGSGVAVMTVNQATGAVTDVVMAQSTGSAILDNAAKSAFRRWRFKPGTVTKVRTPITFTMTGAQY